MTAPDQFAPLDALVDEWRNFSPKSSSRDVNDSVRSVALSIVADLEDAIAEARALAPAPYSGIGSFWTQAEWAEWSNDLARLLPEDVESWPGVNPEGAQESIIETALAQMVADRALAPETVETVEWGRRLPDDQEVDECSDESGARLDAEWLGGTLVKRTTSRTVTDWTEVPS